MVQIQNPMGRRETTTTLTVHPDQRWELADGAKLYDVTHLPCRAARYTPLLPGADGTPAKSAALKAAQAAKLDDKCRKLKGTLRRMGDASDEVRELSTVSCAEMLTNSSSSPSNDAVTNCSALLDEFFAKILTKKPLKSANFSILKI